MRKPLKTFPDFIKVTDDERAAHVCVRDIVFKDGHIETLQIHRPDPALVPEIIGLSSMTAQIESFAANFLRKDMTFVKTISGFSAGQIFLIGWGLASERLFLKAASAAKEIMAEIVCENERNRPDDPTHN